MIDALVGSGRIALIAVAIIVIEVGVLLFYLRRRGGVGRLGLVANGVSGITLLLALHAALTDGSPASVALWLGLGLVAHLADLASRLRRMGD